MYYFGSNLYTCIGLQFWSLKTSISEFLAEINELPT